MHKILKCLKLQALQYLLQIQDLESRTLKDFESHSYQYCFFSSTDLWVVLTPSPGFEEDIEVFGITNTSISSSKPGIGVKNTQNF